MKIDFSKILSLFPKRKKKAKVSLYRKKNIIEINMIGGKYIRIISFCGNGKPKEESHRLYEFLFQNEEIINNYTFTRIIQSLLPKKIRHYDLIFRTNKSILTYESIPNSLLYSSKSIYKKQFLSEWKDKDYLPYTKTYHKKKTDIYRTYLLKKSSVDFIKSIEKKFKIRFDNIILYSDMLYDCYKNPDENILFLFRTYTLVTIVILKKGYPVMEKSFTVNQYMDFIRSFSLALSSYEKDNPIEKIDHYYLYETDNRIREYLLKINITPEEGIPLW